MLSVNVLYIDTSADKKKTISKQKDNAFLSCRFMQAFLCVTRMENRIKISGDNETKVENLFKDDAFQLCVLERHLQVRITQVCLSFRHLFRFLYSLIIPKVVLQKNKEFRKELLAFRYDWPQQANSSSKWKVIL